MTETLNDAQKLAVQNYVSNLVYKWIALIGLANLAAVLGAVSYVYFVIPENASNKAIEYSENKLSDHIKTLNNKYNEKLKSDLEKSQDYLNFSQERFGIQISQIEEKLPEIYNLSGKLESSLDRAQSIGLLLQGQHQELEKDFLEIKNNIEKIENTPELELAKIIEQLQQLEKAGSALSKISSLEENQILEKMPIGSIIAWNKSMEGTPKIHDSWVECNGQKIADKESPYFRSKTPNLNNQVYANGRGYYLRGGNESGKFNESTYYTDNGHKYGTSGKSTYYGASYGSYRGLDSNQENSVTYGKTKLGNLLRFQTAAMSVVWIMKIK